MDSMAGSSGSDFPEHTRLHHAPTDLSGLQKLDLAAAVVVKPPTGRLPRTIAARRREANRPELDGLSQRCRELRLPQR
jgi:hypothetical protein